MERTGTSRSCPSGPARQVAGRHVVGQPDAVGGLVEGVAGRVHGRGVHRQDDGRLTPRAHLGIYEQRVVIPQWENTPPQTWPNTGVLFWVYVTTAREVVRRYLAAYGPATREEFARWFGMTSPAQAGRLIKGLDEEVAPVEVEGSHAWMLAEHVPEAEKAEPSGVVRLLPAFDHYVVAVPRNREAVLPEVLKRRVYRPQCWLSPVVVVDGRMEGVWSHERKGDRLVVEIEPFAEQPEWVRRTAEDEAERLTRFLGGELEFGWSNL